MGEGLWTRWLRPLLVGVGIVVLCVAAAHLLGLVPTQTASPKTATRLHVLSQKDGDSFVASDGNEYRVGMVNAPELDEPCGREAREFSRRFLASGLTVDVYSHDSYGRQVAEVFDRSGQSLNVALAASGYGDDRYLDGFRDENRDLARRLDVAFAASPRIRSCALVPAR